MNIPYALRSKFIALCKESITAQREILNAGQVVSIPLETGGYSGSVIVTLHPSNSIEFETDWMASDPTRFPACIKAAATALRDYGFMGKFTISHVDSILSIKKA